MAIENFLTYAEVDANNKLTVTASKAEGADVDRDEDVYLLYDKGADYFDALDVDFEIYMAASSTSTAKGAVAISNTVGTTKTFADTDLHLRAEKSGTTFYLYLDRGVGAAIDFYICSANTLYYCTFERTAGNDTVLLKIYSDSARTNLLDTLSVSGFGTVKWQYVYGFVNYNDGLTARNFDGYVQNLDLKEVVAGRSFGYIIG